MTGNATHEVRRLIAWRVARNAFFVLIGSLSLGALILRFYGISIPVLRVAGGFIVAVAGWKLLSEGSQKELEASVDGHRRGGFPSRVATRIADPGANANVVGYELVATGEDGTVARQRLDFRYRRAVFDLLPPVAHFQGSGPEPRETRYESDANLVNVSSLTCSFQFDRPIEGEAGRAGTARIFEVGRGNLWVSCFVLWRSDAKARAGGTVEWTARVRDGCTQGRISRSARVNAIR